MYSEHFHIIFCVIPLTAAAVLIHVCFFLIYHTDVHLIDPASPCIHKQRHPYENTKSRIESL